MYQTLLSGIFRLSYISFSAISDCRLNTIGPSTEMEHASVNLGEPLDCQKKSWSKKEKLKCPKVKMNSNKKEKAQKGGDHTWLLPQLLQERKGKAAAAERTVVALQLHDWPKTNDGAGAFLDRFIGGLCRLRAGCTYWTASKPVQRAGLNALMRS